MEPRTGWLVIDSAGRSQCAVVEETKREEKIGMIALTPEEANVMRRGQKIDAIRLVRRRTSLGLLEAKTIIEQWDGKALTTDAPPCPHCHGTGRVGG